MAIWDGLEKSLHGQCLICFLLHLNSRINIYFFLSLIYRHTRGAMVPHTFYVVRFFIIKKKLAVHFHLFTFSSHTEYVKRESIVFYGTNNHIRTHFCFLTRELCFREKKKKIRDITHIAQNIAEEYQKYFSYFIAIVILSQHFCQISQDISSQHINFNFLKYFWDQINI